MVALIGSHGVGKTSLLKALSNVRDNIVTADGSSRIVKGFNQEIGGKLSPIEEQLLINRISDANWNSQIMLKNLFQTRTPLDHYAYSQALGYYEYAQERYELFSNSNFREVKYFYIPIEFDIEEDGIRYLDPEFQKQIDSELQGLIKHFNLEVITLSGSIEERLEKLLKNI
jgi:predicted ATPase